MYNEGIGSDNCRLYVWDIKCSGFTLELLFSVSRFYVLYSNGSIMGCKAVRTSEVVK